jgi:hypothetical protein
LGGGLAVTREAERAEVVEVALSSSFRYGTDVIGIPEGAAGSDGLHSVKGKPGGAGVASSPLERVVDGDGVGLAGGADATVAGKDLVAKVTEVGAETPLVDAIVRAEGATPFGEDLKLAPAAKGEAVEAARERVRLGAASGESAGGMHRVKG